MTETREYTNSFGYQWNQFKTTQFDSYTGIPISENRIRTILGNLWSRLPEFSVLECGCGPGRFTEILLKYSKNLTSVDSSDAADINADFFKQKNVVLKTDVLALDPNIHQYNLVLALGIIQHTPDSDQTIQKMYDYVMPGGYFVFDHYTFLKSYISLRLFYRQILKRLSPVTALKILKKLSLFFMPLHSKIRHNKFLKRILNRISPFITYYDIYPELSEPLQYEWALLDTFDSLTDHYKHFRNRKQICAILKQLGAEIISCQYGGNGVEAVCRKPLNG